jgi:tRNA pseudouridine65 synthase
MEPLEVLFHDDQLIAINKPSGLLVHRSQIDPSETRFALQLVRDQIGQRVYPVHRLDKPTSGVLIFSLNSDAARHINQQIEHRTTTKTYHAIVRGYAPKALNIDHSLKEQLDKFTDRKATQTKEPQTAQTHVKCLATVELPIEIETYPLSRYSLVECTPHTGRKHQIRRHLKHINHPIIGDAKHGRGRHNRYFKSHFDAGRLLLHASSYQLIHPTTGKALSINAPFDACLVSLVKRFNWLEAFDVCPYNPLP